MKNPLVILGASLLLVLVAVLVVIWLPSHPRSPAVALPHAPVVDSNSTALAAGPTAMPDTRAEVKGRFLLPGGAPAHGVHLVLTCSTVDAEHMSPISRSTSLVRSDGKTDADGCFLLRVDSRNALSFTLESKLDGWVDTSWHWRQIEGGTVLDVGDLMLERGGTVRGHVVDAKGVPLIGGWIVTAESLSVPLAPERRVVQVSCATDTVTGEFRTEPLPPGGVRLRAYHAVAGTIEGPRVLVRIGEETHAEVEYGGPDVNTQVTVVVSASPFLTSRMEPFEVFLIASDGSERQAVRTQDSASSWAFFDVVSGSYRVEVRDPRFLPWAVDGVAPGTRVEAKLVGNARLLVSVVDDVTNQPIPRYSLDVRHDFTKWRPNVFRVLDATGDPPPDGVISGIVPFDGTLIVTADGYAPLTIQGISLPSEGVQRVNARLSR